MTKQHVAAAAFVVLALASIPTSASEKPKVPSGQATAVEPSVAIVGTGIDYTRPELASAIRRDAEFEIVGWDFVDNDRRPFEGRSIVTTPLTSERNGIGTRLASVLSNGVLLIPVRIDPANPQSLAKGIGFAARTNVQVVVLPSISANRTNWQVLLAAALEFPNQLFIVAADEALATDVAAATWKTARSLPNVLVVGGEQTGSSSDNRDKESWRSFIHVAPCGNAIHHLQQHDKPLALGALAAMVRHVLDAQSAPTASVASQTAGPSGAVLKRRVLAFMAADLNQKAAPTEKSMKTWVISGYAKQALTTGTSDPAVSSWRLTTGCYTEF
jgi:hypothetical protein